MRAVPTVRSASVMQSLEQRVLLSATQSVSNGILTVTLDNNANAVNIGYTDSQGSNVEVVVNSGTPTLYAQTGGGAQPITGVHVHMGDGTGSGLFLMYNITGSLDELYSIPTTVSGGNGGDLIDDQGGNGSNDSAGSFGTDKLTVFGGAGNDTIKAGNGNDVILTGNGGDSISTGNGNDLILGEGPHASAGDTITVGDGNDTIFALGGNDSITCGNGASDLIFASDGDSITGGTGRDKVYILRGETITVSGPNVPVKSITNKRADAIYLKGRQRAIHTVVADYVTGAGF